jgi:hypothetical protein
MNSCAIYWGLVVKLGVATNFLLCALGVFAPQVIFSLLQLEPATPDFWARMGSWLLFLLTLAYIPAANNPFMSPALSWLTIGARWGGFIFISTSVVLLDLSPGFLALALYDLLYAIPQLVLLLLALRAREREATARVPGPAGD